MRYMVFCKDEKFFVLFWCFLYKSSSVYHSSSSLLLYPSTPLTPQPLCQANHVQDLEYILECFCFVLCTYIKTCIFIGYFFSEHYLLFKNAMVYLLFLHASGYTGFSTKNGAALNIFVYVFLCTETFIPMEKSQKQDCWVEIYFYLLRYFKVATIQAIKIQFCARKEKILLSTALTTGVQIIKNISI